MTRLRRLAAVSVTAGVLLSASACGTSVPVAVGSYTVTFVYTIKPGAPNRFGIGEHSGTMSLVLAPDGHFVLTSLARAGGSLKGSWSEVKSKVTLSSGTGTSKVILIASLKGRNLQERGSKVLGLSGPIGYAVEWRAIRD
jgi:hypothetical protein